VIAHMSSPLALRRPKRLSTLSNYIGISLVAIILNQEFSGSIHCN
jgi:hypothetical protein